MKSAYHTLIISVAIGLTYIWLKLPALNQYSLQLFAVTVLIYFVIKKIHKARFWQLMPTHASIEMAVVTVAFLLLIGATGNLKSVLFALSFVHLFLLALKTDLVTACVVTIEIVLFHFALTQNPSVGELSFLISLPVVMIFFLFAKQQYFRVFAQQRALAAEQEQLVKAQQIDHQLESFLSGFLEEKLGKLQRLSFFPAENQRQMQAEMAEIAVLTDELIAQTQAQTAETETNLGEPADGDEIIATSIDIFETTLVETIPEKIEEEHEGSQQTPSTT